MQLLERAPLGLKKHPHSELRLTQRARVLTLTPTADRNMEASKATHMLQKSPSPSHEELMQRVAAHKDRAAFGELFGHFAPRVKSYLLKMGMNGTGAEDTAQDVMVSMWEKAHLFDPTKAKLSTWLFRIARNKFIDLTRKHRFPEVDVDDHLRDVAADDKTDEATIANQESKAVAKALRALSPEQRQAVEASFFEDLTHSEASAKLQIPLGTVKSRLRLAFKALRKELDEQ